MFSFGLRRRLSMSMVNAGCSSIPCRNSLRRYLKPSGPFPLPLVATADFRSGWSIAAHMYRSPSAIFSLCSANFVASVGGGPKLSYIGRRKWGCLAVL